MHARTPLHPPGRKQEREKEKEEEEEDEEKEKKEEKSDMASKFQFKTSLAVGLKIPLYYQEKRALPACSCRYQTCK